MRGRAVLGLPALLLTLACGAAGREERRAHLEARWTGADTGRLDAPASAEWCGAGKFLEIRAGRADSGLGLAIFARDTVVPGAGRYRVLLGERADSNRPAAAVAVRWYEGTAVYGFRADTGTVTLERGPDGALSGRITASGRLLRDDTVGLRVDGSFRDLLVRSATQDCAPVSAGRSDSAGGNGGAVPDTAVPGKSPPGKLMPHKPVPRKPVPGTSASRRPAPGTGASATAIPDTGVD